eukprot:TRINITY_DN3957_c0_g1_i1.p1 TRINITY_DN3957_c0_g1~~TRINITY_DN3957_c0_g1_i1.p1  ORF type:complete len:394 (+),score=170.60 TRINITY_DN3957_c0_g1_i1:135-1316(+)
MSIHEQNASKIVTAMDLDSDGSLSKEEIVTFLNMLNSMLPDADVDRPSEDEAEGIVNDMGVDGAVPAEAFKTFLVSFCESEQEKAALILEGLAKSRAQLYAAMHERVKTFDGFLAALDQSGGSSPKALLAYGVEVSEYNGDQEMFDKIHEMRTRIVSCPAFNGDDVLGAILFEMTMDREFNGVSSAKYLWEQLNVVPFVKCDKGLADEENDCQLMKPMPDLDALMIRAAAKGVYGTKERSLIKQANPEGIKAVVAQQFQIGAQIISHGLMPIIEPEVDINSETKTEAEELLKAAILSELETLPEGQTVMLKLTIPTVDNLYKELVDHPKVLKVVALSGGYPREEANRRLSLQNGMIASFSRALTEGLNAKMGDEEYNAALEEAIKSIHKASSS